MLKIFCRIIIGVSQHKFSITAKTVDTAKSPQSEYICENQFLVIFRLTAQEIEMAQPTYHPEGWMKLSSVDGGFETKL